MQTQSTVTVNKTKGQLIQIKRLITEAGKIQDKIAEDVKQLADLKKEIKEFTMDMASDPAMTIVLVSGTHVATLSEEKLERVTGPKQSLALFGYLGLEGFMDIATFPIPAMKKAVGDEVFDEVCPEQYSGKGRVFKLKAKA